MSNEDWSHRQIDDGVDRGGRAVNREIERLKGVYRQHADTLAALAASAPTKALSRKYGELIGEINRSILGLEDPGAIAPRTSERPIEQARPAPSTQPEPTGGRAAEMRLRTEPGTYSSTGESDQSALGRIALILGMAIIVIGVLAFFVWKFGEPRVDTPSTPEASAVAPVDAAAPPPAPTLSANPEAQDFGVVYKGTRVAKAFTISNHTDRDLTIEAERSKCRCLWFDYAKVIPAGGTVEMTIAVDGGLAEPGLISEAVVVSTTEQPRFATEIQITAEIR